MDETVVPTPMVLLVHLLSMQVCVPEQWSDGQVEAFANQEHPAGTTHGWRVRKEGDEALAGAAERVKCGGPDRPGFVHVMLDC